MYNCFLMIFTAMSGVGAVTGVIAAICIFFRQKKIALFERRMKILNDFEQFVFVVLRDWDWDGSTTLVSKYSEQEVALLFNEEYSELQKDIFTDSIYIIPNTQWIYETVLVDEESDGDDNVGDK